MRQAFAGMLWSKQLYDYDVARWLDGDPTQPAAAGVAAAAAATPAGATSTPSTSCRCPTSGSTRGSRPGTSAFHCVALAHVDPAFAKYQLLLICREWFQHPNGALPAYEWDFGDVNPPVQAWAALEVFAIDGGRDLDFLSQVFDKLLVNFTWWVNREDADGSNLFEGGFLGLDNIGPLDRSHLPVGGHARAVRRHRLDGVLRAGHGDHRRRSCTARGSGRPPTSCSSSSSTSPRSARRWTTRGCGTRPTGSTTTSWSRRTATSVPVKVRSMVGIIPLLAAVVVDEAMLDRAQRLGKQFAGFLDARGPRRPRGARRGRAAAGRARASAAAARRRRHRPPASGCSTKLFDEDEFLSPLRAAGGVGLPPRPPLRARGRGRHGDDRLRAGRVDHGDVRRQLQLAGPALVPAQLPRGQRARALPPLLRRRLHGRVPDRVGAAAARWTRSPTTCGDRLVSLFLVGAGRPAAVLRRASSGSRHDPAWKDNLVFNEYFHGDNGAGLGATHQTGWTGSSPT